MSKSQRTRSDQPQSSPPLAEPQVFVASRSKLLLLCLSAFVSGGAILIVELTGNRLLAPLFGNSLYTWTALIGVVLVAISVGDYFGGWLVDRRPQMAVLGYLLIVSAGLTMLIPPIYGALRESMADSGLIAGPIIVSLVLFSIPSCLLGAVTPFIIRMLSRTARDMHIGLSAGLVGMLGTLGSFVGTFLTGFVLIPSFGVRHIFLFTGIAVGLLGLAAAFLIRDDARHKPSFGLPALLLAPLLVSLVYQPRLDAGTLHQESSFYHEITVTEMRGPDGRRVRQLQLDSTMEGAQYVDTGDTYFGYQAYWQLAEVFCRQGVDRALFLGGGGFAMPEQLAGHYEQARVDVVEIDPQVIEVGRKYFRLDESPRVSPHAADARRWLLMEASDRYDLIFGDAYNGVRYVPAHLVTAEFFALVKSRLADDGVYMMNLVSPGVGERAELFGALLTTLRTQFKHVEVFAVAPGALQAAQNLIIVAADKDLADLLAADEERSPRVEQLLETRLDASLYAHLGGPLLTDDYNPVEWLVARQLLSVE